MKSNFVYLILIVLMTAQCLDLYPQKQNNDKLDSLLLILNTINDNDTAKCSLYATIANKLKQTDPDEGIKYAQKGLALANKLGYKKAAAYCAKSIGLCYYTKYDYSQAIVYYSIAINNLSHASDKHDMAGVYMNMGMAFLAKSDYANASKHFMKAIGIFESTGNKNGMAKGYGNIGLVYSSQSDYPKALEFHLKALKLNEETGNKKGIADNCGNIGNVYSDWSENTKALEYYHKALKIDLELNNQKDIASDYSSIGNIYLEQKDYPKSIEYFNKALIINKELKNKKGLAGNYGNMGIVYFYQSDNAKALKYYFESLKLNEELQDKSGIMINTGNIGAAYFSMADSIPDKASYAILKTKHDYLHQVIVYTQKANRFAKEIRAWNELILWYLNLSLANKVLGQWKTAYLYADSSHKLQDSIFSSTNKKRIEIIETKRNIELKEKEHEIEKLEKIRLRNERLALIGGIALLILVSLIVIRERMISEKLLLNILPAMIAKRLKKKENPIADHIVEASVLFADVVNFTELSSQLGADRTVNELNKIFTILDKMAEKHGVEKIKTIGDCYMAAAGVPIPMQDHALRSANLALDIQKYFNQYKTGDGIQIQLRIGLDSGEVTAGVIGKKRFIYDLWGDTVNTASRMETYSLSGKIHCSQRFKNTLEKSLQGNNIAFIERGDIEIKGKGLMKTWFIETAVSGGR